MYKYDYVYKNIMYRWHNLAMCLCMLLAKPGAISHLMNICVCILFVDCMFIWILFI